MKKGNLIFAGIFTLLSVAVITRSCMYPEGQNGIPGPGFFPILVAVVMLLASISLVISSLRMKPDEDRPLVLSSPDNKRAYKAMGIMLAYLIIMPVVGFCVTTFLLLLIQIRWLSPYRFRTCCGISLLVVALIYVVFRLVLNVLLGFGILF